MSASPYAISPGHAGGRVAARTAQQLPKPIDGMSLQRLPPSLFLTTSRPFHKLGRLFQSLSKVTRQDNHSLSRGAI